jgi:hypothetical protein
MHERRLKTRTIVAAVTALVAAMVWAAPTGADPKPKVEIDAVVSGTSQTTELPTDQGLLFEQYNTLTVEGTFNNKPLTGTLDYQVRVHIPGPGMPANFPGGALTQPLTFTSNRGDLSSEDSWYASPVIGFECLGTDLADCVDHNAVIFQFAGGTGSFSNLPNSALWTMRVERHSTNGVVTDGTLTAGIGLGIRYCHSGQMTTAPSSGLGMFRTTMSLTMISGACYAEDGNLVDKMNVPGGPMSFDYAYNWSATGFPPNIEYSFYPDAASAWNDAGTMTGLVSSLYVPFPPFFNIQELALGGEWGELTGIFAKYRYALIRTFNMPTDFTWPPTSPTFPVGTSTIRSDSGTIGFLAVY